MVSAAEKVASGAQHGAFGGTNRQLAKQISEFVKSKGPLSSGDVVDLASKALESRPRPAGAVQSRQLRSAKRLAPEAVGTTSAGKAVALAGQAIRTQAEALGVKLPKAPDVPGRILPSGAVVKLLARLGLPMPAGQQEKVAALDRLPRKISDALGAVIDSFEGFESAAEALGENLSPFGGPTSDGRGGTVSGPLNDPDVLVKLTQLGAAGPEDLEKTYVDLFGEITPEQRSLTKGPPRSAGDPLPVAGGLGLRLAPVLAARLALLEASARLSEAVKGVGKGALGDAVRRATSSSSKDSARLPGIPGPKNENESTLTPGEAPAAPGPGNANPPGGGGPGLTPGPTGPGGIGKLPVEAPPASKLGTPAVASVPLRLAQAACAPPTIDIPPVLALELDGRDNNGADGCIYGLDRNADGKTDKPDTNLDGKIDDGDADYRLVLDLGGDDTYRNNAGGTGQLTKSPLASQPLSGVAAALIDLDGADRYISGRDRGINGGAATGAGFLFDAGQDDPATSNDEGADVYTAGSHGGNGGASVNAGSSTGFLLDASGDDVYSSADNGTNGGAYSQTSAAAPAVGTGLLVDAAGDDKYIAGSAGANGGASGASLTQPATLGGFVLDGGGDDIYSGGRLGANGGAGGGSGGQGGFASFTGVLMDLSGSDSYTAAGNFGFDGDYAPGNTGVNGGGWTFGILGGVGIGTGLLYDAGGSDAYRAGDSAVNGGGFGGGALGGFGYGAGSLIDAGGNDDYGAQGSGSNGGANGLGGLGGAGYSTGFLMDGGGNDSYAASSAGANGGGFVSDQLGASVAEGFLADLSGDDAYKADNDGANGGAVLGSGFLQDISGNDIYVAGENGTDGGSGVGAVVVSIAGGAGLLTDEGGADTYSDTNPSTDCASTFINENDCNGTGLDRTVEPKGKAGAQEDKQGPDVPAADKPELDNSVGVDVSFDPTDHITADKVATTGAVAKVTRAGAGVPGLRIEFTTDGDVTFGQVRDDGNGVYQATVYSSTTAGSEIVMARAFGGPDELGRGRAVLTERAGPAAALALALDPAKIVADGSATTLAAAAATDAFSNRVKGVSAQFSTDGDVVLPDPPKCVTGQDGSCKISIRASRTPGSQTVTAVIPETSIKASADLVEEALAARIQLKLDPSTLPSDGGSRSLATAEVTDASGAKVSGERVAFKTDGDVAISPTTNNNDGTYTATIRASETEGVETITSTALSSGASAQADLTELDSMRFDEDQKGAAGGVFLTGKDADKHAPGSESSRHVIQRAVTYATSKERDAHILLVAGPGGGSGTAASGMVAAGFRPCPKDPSLLEAAAADAVAPVSSKKNYLGCFEQADGRPITDAERRERGEEAKDLRTVRFTDYDGVVVASNRLRSGYLTQVDMDVLVQRRAELIDYVNRGGGLVALASVNETTASDVAPPFGFLPCLEAVHNINKEEVGFSVTPFGRAMGLTDADVNGYVDGNSQASHNYFAGDSGFGIVEVDDLRRIISMATRRGLSPQGCGLPSGSKADTKRDSEARPSTGDQQPTPRDSAFAAGVSTTAPQRAGELGRPPALQSDPAAPPEPAGTLVRQQVAAQGPPQAPAASTQVQVQQQLQTQAEVSQQGEVFRAVQTQAALAGEKQKQRQVTVETVPTQGASGKSHVLHASARVKFPISAVTAPIAALVGLLIATAKPSRKSQEALARAEHHRALAAGSRSSIQARRRRRN